MSGRVAGRVFERVLGSAPNKAVLLCLAEHANPDGKMSYPSVNRIAQETELGESTVRKALGWLRDERLIIQTRRAKWHRTATYRINLPRLQDFPLVEVYQKEVYEEEEDLQGGTPDLYEGQSDLQERTPDLQDVDPNRPRTVLEPSEEPSEEPFAHVVQTWEKACGPITAMIAENLGDLADEAEAHRLSLPEGSEGRDRSGNAWVVEAITEAVKSASGGRPNVKYIEAIMKRWLGQGFKAGRDGDGRPGAKDRLSAIDDHFGRKRGDGK